MQGNICCPQCNSTSTINTNSIWEKSKCLNCGLYFDYQLERLVQSISQSSYRAAFTAGNAYADFIESKKLISSCQPKKWIKQ